MMIAECADTRDGEGGPALDVSSLRSVSTYSEGRIQITSRLMTDLRLCISDCNTEQMVPRRMPPVQAARDGGQSATLLWSSTEVLPTFQTPGNTDLRAR